MPAPSTDASPSARGSGAGTGRRVRGARTASAASATVATPTASSPGTSRASASVAAGTSTRRTPAAASARPIGSTPGTLRTSPPRPSSPISATRPRVTRSCSDPSRIPIAIARSSDAPAFRQLRRGEVHGDPPRWVVVARVAQRPADALPRLGQGRVRQPHDREPRQPGRDVDLHPDEPPGEAVERGGEQGREHERHGRPRHSSRTYAARRRGTIRPAPDRPERDPGRSERTVSQPIGSAVEPHAGERLWGAVRDAVWQAVVVDEAVLRLLSVAVLAHGHVLDRGRAGRRQDAAGAGVRRALGLGLRARPGHARPPARATSSAPACSRAAAFRFIPGPVFTNILLVDEINRATPRTQSALLEAMEEGHVSIEGETRDLPDPFLVLATENPIELEGTFALPEAQLDRFLVRIRLGYPSRDDEARIARRYRASAEPLEAVAPVLRPDELLAMRESVRAVEVSAQVEAYIVDLVRETRRAAGGPAGRQPAVDDGPLPGDPGVGLPRRPRLRPARRRQGAGPGRPRATG